MFPYQPQLKQSGPESSKIDEEESPMQVVDDHHSPETYLSHGPDLGQVSAYGSDAPGHWNVISGPSTFSIPQVDFLQAYQQSLHSRYSHLPSASDEESYPHLNQTVEIGDRERRQAVITSPFDRALLVKQALDNKHSLPYVKLETPSFSSPDSTLDLGRISASPFPSGAREQHFYDSNGTFTPYPAEGQRLQSLATNGVTEQQVWQSLHSVSRGDAPVPQLMEHELELQSVPTIFNISETQRSHLMSASSDLEVANQAHTSEEPRDFRSAFGYSSKNVNYPGTISATGSGAVHQFGAFETALMDGDLSDEAICENVTRAPKGMTLETARDLAVERRDNVLNTFGERMAMTDIEKAAELSDEEDREDAVSMRLMSGVNRSTLPQMGLMKYNLRPLLKQTPPKDEEL
jgi:hypothetical protein